MRYWLRAAVVIVAIVAAGGCALLYKATAELDLNLMPGVQDIGSPSWSPDGSALVFHIQTEGRSEIYRVDIDESDVVQLTSADAYSRSPAFAPDGSRIAFTRAPDYLTYALYLAESDGSRARPLLGAGVSGLDPSWSPDGRRIVVVDGSVDQVLGSAGRLMTVRTDGRGRRRLVGPVQARNPAWSPDGRWIAFSRSENEVYGVYVVPAEGGRERLVIKQASDPAWSPDGKRLAVSRGLKGIFVVPLDGGRPQRLPIHLPDGPGLSDLAWSPNGRHIAFATVEALYIANTDGSGSQRVASLDDAG